VEIVAIEQADEERAESLRKEYDALIVPELCHPGCDHLFHCGTGSGSFTVSYDGRFRLCSDLCQLDCTYDLRQGSLAEVMLRSAISSSSSHCEFPMPRAACAPSKKLLRLSRQSRERVCRSKCVAVGRQ